MVAARIEANASRYVVANESLFRELRFFVLCDSFLTSLAFLLLRTDKAYVSTLLASEDAAPWVETVDADVLAKLGGDANRLFQLLVDDKGSNAADMDAAVLKAAITREDIFSEKQVKKMSLLLEKQDDSSRKVKAEGSLYAATATEPLREIINESFVKQGSRREVSKCMSMS